MRQIRLGLMGNLPVSYYAKPEFDWLQMEEIRKGLKDKVDVTKYADAAMTYGMMRQIRKALSIGLDLSEYKNLHPGVLKQMRKAVQSKVDIMPYVKAGYDEEQLEQIRIALDRYKELCICQLKRCIFKTDKAWIGTEGRCLTLRQRGYELAADARDKAWTLSQIRGKILS